MIMLMERTLDGGLGLLWIQDQCVKTTISHISPTRMPPYSCNEFMFENITALPGAVSDLNSTAVVNPLPLDLSGFQMECVAGGLSTSPSVGNDILCAIGE